MKMIFKSGWFISVCSLVVFLTLFSVLAAEKTGTYDLFEYRPLVPGTRFVYSVSGSDSGSSTMSFSVLREEKRNGVTLKVLDWGNGWMDYWEETSNAVTRHKHENTAEKTHGIYDPPAVQYPRFLEPGGKFRQDRLLRTYNKGHLVSTDTEKFHLVLQGVEDVTVPYGTFPNCLKIFAEWRILGADGKEYQRKSALTWNAKGVGQVKGIYYERKDAEKKSRIMAYMELKTVTSTSKISDALTRSR